VTYSSDNRNALVFVAASLEPIIVIVTGIKGYTQGVKETRIPARYSRGSENKLN